MTNLWLKLTLGLIMTLLLGSPTLAQANENSATTEKLAAAEARALKVQWGKDNSRFEQAMEISSKLFLARIIVLYKTDGLLSQQSGSAFLVRYNNKNYFLSADHIFTDDNDEPLPQDFHAIVILNGNRYYFDKTDIYLDHWNDVMVTRAPENLTTDLILDEELELRVGKKTIAIGYPNKDFMAAEGIVTHVDSNFSTFDCTIFFGSSGGPVITVDKQKNLAGIITSFADNKMTGTKSPSLKNIVKAVKTFNSLHNIQ